nr:MAG TPA: hypothetical protein [Bacteriophage sp.]
MYITITDKTQTYCMTRYICLTPAFRQATGRQGVEPH